MRRRELEQVGLTQLVCCCLQSDGMDALLPFEVGRAGHAVRLPCVLVAQIRSRQFKPRHDRLDRTHRAATGLRHTQRER